MGKVDLYGGKDPRDVPMYGFAEAASLLHVPTSTLRSWTVGQDYSTRAGTKRFVPPVPLAKGQRALTFYNLIEAYVLASMRRDFNVALREVRDSVNYVRTEMNVERPLLEEDFYTDGVDLMIERSGVFMNTSRQGQTTMIDFIKDYFHRVKRDEKGLAARLYPWRRDIHEAEIVEIDPTRAFGKAVVTGTNISIGVLIARRRAGDTVAQLARDFALDRDKVSAVVEWDVATAA